MTRLLLVVVCLSLTATIVPTASAGPVETTCPLDHGRYEPDTQEGAPVGWSQESGRYTAWVVGPDEAELGVWAEASATCLADATTMAVECVVAELQRPETAGRVVAQIEVDRAIFDELGLGDVYDRLYEGPDQPGPLTDLRECLPVE